MDRLRLQDHQHYRSVTSQVYVPTVDIETVDAPWLHRAINAPATAKVRGWYERHSEIAPILDSLPEEPSASTAGTVEESMRTLVAPS